ncbi:MAG: hypothetical protein ABL994_22165, partial [Verrucomicrobiales bacterium]
MFRVFMLAGGLSLISCSSTIKVKTNTAALTRECIQSADLLEGLGHSIGSVVSSFGDKSATLLRKAHSLE